MVGYETFPTFELKEFTIIQDITTKAIKATLLELFNISQENQVVKMRNHRGCLIPISNNLPANAPKKAYVLEVCRLYNAVTPRPRTVSLPTYQQLLRRRLHNIDERLLKLEQTVPRLPTMRKEALLKDIKDLSMKMEFLNQKIQVVDDFQWKGMFERNPLW